MTLADLRRAYHRRLVEQIIRLSRDSKKGIEYPNFADGSSRSSVSIALGIVQILGHELQVGITKGQTSGASFESITKEFVEDAFNLLIHLRPGRWLYSTHQAISEFDQYKHLAYLEKALKNNKELASSLGRDYIITPDIVVARQLVTDNEINQPNHIVDVGEPIAQLTALRAANSLEQQPLLHASISCKWTIRSDRVQNARTEALNLIRNRKGHLPHVVSVTAEPLPTRIAALALGTGDLDCVYHIALPELQQAIVQGNNTDQLDMLTTLIDGRRLRDISDLPFDLAT
jgi:hypothetical protein